MISLLSCSWPPLPPFMFYLYDYSWPLLRSWRGSMSNIENIFVAFCPCYCCCTPQSNILYVLADLDNDCGIMLSGVYANAILSALSNDRLPATKHHTTWSRIKPAWLQIKEECLLIWSLFIRVCVSIPVYVFHVLFTNLITYTRSMPSLSRAKWVPNRLVLQDGWKFWVSQVKAGHPLDPLGKCHLAKHHQTLSCSFRSFQDSVCLVAMKNDISSSLRKHWKTNETDQLVCQVCPPCCSWHYPPWLRQLG